MSTGAGIDYSAWDHVYISDDEDVTSPHVDTQSLFRMRHRARLERMVAFQQRGEELENNISECKRLLEAGQGRLKELEDGKKEGDEDEDEEREAELKKVQAEVKILKKDEKSFQKMIEEYRREENKQPWDVDSISKDGFSKSVLNIKPVTKEETEKEKVEKHKTFVEKYAKEIKHFGMLRRWDDSQKYLSDGPHLVCEETANCLVVICIDFQIEEKPALMEQVAHQAIVMQFILDLARTLKVDARGCFREFFSKITTADKPYLDAFDQELGLLKDRIRRCARARVENTVKELEEEERQMRLGPGGLDPLEVYQSLPKEVQKGFDEENIQLLQEAMGKLGVEEGKYHLRRCIDSGLWVPQSGDSDDEEDGEEEDEEDDS
ncbi:hsp90 co-chaperone Cdc37 isoform X1 [Pseudochaenichthys georgianus]|uniref:hsp90 co-chaperone Cdc37 isoform X1 n=2 Tax=Pseudochaenichthys georgianus TaxID=52239 RepID=UPI00146C7640|nr:hsp90 co-chaperone Cdc37 isoform X1 [Pseudochaenichthys georgianus]